MAPRAEELACDWTADLPASGNNKATRAHGVRPPGQTIQGLWTKEKSPKEQDSPELGALHLPAASQGREKSIPRL